MLTNYDKFMLTILSFITILALMHKFSTDIFLQSRRMNDYVIACKN